MQSNGCNYFSTPQSQLTIIMKGTPGLTLLNNIHLFGSDDNCSKLKMIPYNDVTMSAMTYQITGVPIVCLTVCSGVERKHQSYASLAFVRGTTGGFPSQRASNTERFPFDDVIMYWRNEDQSFATIYFVVKKNKSPNIVLTCAKYVTKLFIYWQYVNLLTPWYLYISRAVVQRLRTNRHFRNSCITII